MTDEATSPTGSPPTADPPGRRRALLVDYGGVLTNDIGAVFARFDEVAGLPAGTLQRVVVEAYQQPDGQGFVHRMERGELDAEGFGAAIQGELMANGYAVRDPSIFAGVFDELRPDHESGMWAVVRAAREHGIATVLVSNSWGTDGYPMDELREVFDELVISGEVGLRKPDPAIFELACGRVGVALADAVFVDDFEVNTSAAEVFGIPSVLHRGDVDATRERLEHLLGVALR